MEKEKYGHLPGQDESAPPREGDLLNVWMTALVKDDIDTVISLLEDEKSKSCLMNCIFDFCPLALKSRNMGLKKTEFTVRSSWATSLVNGAFRVMQYLYDRGIDIFVMDHQENNAIHSLIGAAALNLDNEEKYDRILGFLRNMLPSDAYIKCLVMENSDGLRPLEYAANVGTFRLMMTIFETQRLYLTRQESYGLQILQYFDLTEYESVYPEIGCRREKSPIKMLLYLDEALLRRPNTHWIYGAEPFASWGHAKEAAIKPFLALWLLFRVVFFVLFFVAACRTNDILRSIEQIQTNGTTGDCYTPHLTWTPYDKGIIIVLIVTSLISLFVDIFELTEWNMRCPQTVLMTPRGKKTLCVRYAFYRITQFLLAVEVVILALGHILHFSGLFTPPKELINLLSILASFGCIWSLLYFVQLAPVVGHYVISIQSMMKEFAQFLFIFIPFFLPYCMLFWVLLRDNSSGDCPTDFVTFYDSIYGSVKIMVNMVDFNDYDVQDNVSLAFLHIFYVFFVAILLVNFLIALLSIAYDDVASNRNVINHVQRLSVTYQVEARLVRSRCSLLERLQKRHFFCEHGRIYMTRLLMKNPEHC